MVELHLIYVFMFAVAGVFALAAASVAWRRRVAPGALSLVVLMLGTGISSGAEAMMWYAPALGAQIFWLRATSLGMWMVPVGVLLLAFDIARTKRWRTPGRIALISIASFALANIRWLNPGRLYDEAFVAQTMGPYTHYEPIPGPIYWASTVFTLAMIVTGLIIIFRVYLRSSGSTRTQAAVLFVGGLIPFLAAVATKSGLLPLEALDLTPVAFVVTGALWLGAILRGTLLEVLPLARETLLDQMVDGVIVIDGEDHIADANPAALTMLHRPLVEVLGKPAEAILRCMEGATTLLGGSGPRHAVLPIGSDGDSRYLELGVTPLAVAVGEPSAQLVTLHDVTEERQASERLELARTVFDTANEAVVVTLPDAGEEIVDVNNAYCRLTGRLREDTVGQDIRCLQSDRHPPEFFQAMEEALLTTGEWKGEVWQRRADGTVFPSWMSLTLAKVDEGHARQAVGVFTDISEIREAEDKLRHSATHDALTGLPNRFLLDDRLEHALANARRERNGLAVLFVDLDDFKTVNDTLGHAQGDALLVEVAKRLAGAMRESDTVSRPGGDEFTILITDIGDPAYVEVTARRMLDAITSPCSLGDEDVHITASIGIALFPSDGADATTLSQHADLAMYGAKALGRNRLQFFSEAFQEGLDRRAAVEKELWGADDENRYFLLYQPQVDLSTGRITGAEALVRLRARDGTVLSPAEFIPVAENSELILQLGDWVLRTACAELAIIREVAPDLIMSLNFSARQFSEMDVAALHDVLRESGVEARSLALEVTETAFLVDPAKAAAKLDDLRDVAGIRLALDDFGTGYSSLTYVRMFRADTIKIDRSFVELLPDDPDARAIVRSTIALAKEIGATVVGEGPETEEQVRFLRASGCDIAQGFYFSRPIPADELTLLLRGEPFELPDVLAVSADVVT